LAILDQGSKLISSWRASIAAAVQEDSGALTLLGEGTEEVLQSKAIS
jgi:hypothetical protein